MLSVVSSLLLLAAALTVGYLVGRQASRGRIEKAIKSFETKLRAEIEAENKDTAVKMHKELAKIRNGIVDSAHAYQAIVRTIDEKISPWEDVAGVIGSTDSHALPLVIGTAEPQKRSEEKGDPGVEAAKETSKVRSDAKSDAGASASGETDTGATAEESIVTSGVQYRSDSEAAKHGSLAKDGEENSSQRDSSENAGMELASNQAKTPLRSEANQG